MAMLHSVLSNNHVIFCGKQGAGVVHVHSTSRVVDGPRHVFILLAGATLHRINFFHLCFTVIV